MCCCKNPNIQHSSANSHQQNLLPHKKCNYPLILFSIFQASSFQEDSCPNLFIHFFLPQFQLHVQPIKFSAMICVSHEVPHYILASILRFNSSLLGPNIFLNSLLPYTNLCSYLKVRDHTSRPNNANSRLIVVCILNFCVLGTYKNTVHPCSTLIEKDSVTSLPYHSH
jgi:hypothetical protein